MPSAIAAGPDDSIVADSIQPFVSLPGDQVLAAIAEASRRH